MAIPNISLPVLVILIVVVSLAILGVSGTLGFLYFRTKKVSNQGTGVGAPAMVERQWDPESFHKSSLRGQGTENPSQYTRPPPERVLHIAKEGARWSTSSDSTIVAAVTRPEPNYSFLTTDPMASPSPQDDKKDKYDVDDSRWSTATGATKVGPRESMPAPRIPSIVVQDNDDDLDLPVMIYQPGSSANPFVERPQDMIEERAQGKDENEERSQSVEEEASKKIRKLPATPDRETVQPMNGSSLTRAMQNRDSALTELQLQLETLKGHGYFADLDVPTDIIEDHD